MKKSEIYKKAQVSIVTDPNLNPMEMLEILRELFQKEDVALFTEKEKEKAE